MQRALKNEERENKAKQYRLAMEGSTVTYGDSIQVYVCNHSPNILHPYIPIAVNWKQATKQAKKQMDKKTACIAVIHYVCFYTY